MNYKKATKVLLKISVIIIFISIYKNNCHAGKLKKVNNNEWNIYLLLTPEKPVIKADINKIFRIDIFFYNEGKTDKIAGRYSRKQQKNTIKSKNFKEKQKKNSSIMHSGKYQTTTNNEDLKKHPESLKNDSESVKFNVKINYPNGLKIKQGEYFPSVFPYKYSAIDTFANEVKFSLDKEIGKEEGISCFVDFYASSFLKGDILIDIGWVSDNETYSIEKRIKKVEIVAPYTIENIFPKGPYNIGDTVIISGVGLNAVKNIKLNNEYVIASEQERNDTMIAIEITNIMPDSFVLIIDNKIINDTLANKLKSHGN